ncbi:hypothetical protein BSU04_35595 [Caballeronia sordidicola]|uniref:Uncharacterized protein n=1 Tax=Caballeronia sordidicola TaxID=196367 RepID=A0A226WRU5_CABSO|nr:hypothetical protein BSU04_35595 [Caballeronia sordidicola]
MFASGDELPDDVLLDFSYKRLRRPCAMDELNDPRQGI